MSNEIRLIDANALEEKLHDIYASYESRKSVEGGSAIITAEIAVDESPTIEAEPVRHGYWLHDRGYVNCSVCNERKLAGDVILYNYCPNCGTKMDGGENNK